MNKYSTDNNLGKILSIKCISDEYHSDKTYEGFEIRTNKHTYKLLISSATQGSESAGYFSMQQNFKEAVSDTLIAIELNTNYSREVKDYDDLLPRIITIDDVNFYFISFYTNKDKLQIAVYNHHNGYYAHSVLVFCDDKKIDSTEL